MQFVPFIARFLMLIAFLLAPLAPGAVAMNGGNNPVEQDAAVYPNPAQDFVFVRIDRVPFSLPEGSDVSIEIVDILGNSMNVQLEQINAITYRIDLNQCPAGYYLLVVHCNSCADTEKGIFKFLKQ